MRLTLSQQDNESTQDKMVKAHQDCAKALRDSMDKYGVDNWQDLYMTMYAPLVKRYKIKDFNELQLFFQNYKRKKDKLEMERIKLKFEKITLNKYLNSGDLGYYLENILHNGWENIDKPIKKSQEFELKLQNSLTENTTASVIDSALNGLIPIILTEGKVAINLQKNKQYHVIVIKIIAGSIFLGIEAIDTRRRDLKVDVKLNRMSYKIFNDKLRQLISPAFLRN